MENPYLQEFLKVEGGRWHTFDFNKRTMRDVRLELMQRYSHAIPTDEALAAIAALGPEVVELGAGSGYWAKLLADSGVTVHAYDAVLPDSKEKNEYWHPTNCWYPISQGRENVLAKHSKASLLLCWPTDFANRAVKNFKGEHIVYIGEGECGCTATEAFFKRLHRDWNEIQRIDIPQWAGIRDSVKIYKRKNGG